MFAFIAALVVVVGVGLKSRLWGAVLSLVWCVALTGWGYWQIEQGAHIRLFMFESNPVLLGLVMGGFILYNAARVVLEVRRQRLTR